MSAESSSRKYAINTSWILIEKLSRILSGILVGILVARYLGPEQFGMISYALNVVAIFAIFSTLGMDSIIIRELITRKTLQNTVLGTAFGLRLIGAVCVVIGATYYSSIRDDAQNTYIVFLVSTSVVLQAFTVIDFYFQAAVLGKFTAINQVITLCISSIAKIIFIFTHAPVEYFAAMVFVEALLTTINQLLFYKYHKQHVRLWRFSLDEAKTLLSHAWPIILSGLVMVVYQKMDQILIKRWLNMNLLGNYAAAVRISEASFFIPVAICSAIFPGIVNIRDNKTLQEKRLVQLYSLMIWSGLTISLGGLLVGDWVIPLLYKEKYYLASSVFKIHIWCTIPVFYGTAWAMWLLSENKQYYLIFLQVILLAVSLFANTQLIPIFGINGAAYALVITQFASLAILLSIYKPQYSWGLFRRALNPKNMIDILAYLRNK